MHSTAKTFHPNTNRTLIKSQTRYKPCVWHLLHSTSIKSPCSNHQLQALHHSPTTMPTPKGCKCPLFLSSSSFVLCSFSVIALATLFTWNHHPMRSHSSHQHLPCWHETTQTDCYDGHHPCHHPNLSMSHQPSCCCSHCCYLCHFLHPTHASYHGYCWKNPNCSHHWALHTHCWSEGNHNEK